MTEPKATEGVSSLGELLKSARQRRGMTLRELAHDRDIGVSATFLSRVERNESLPSDELLLKLARKLELDASVALMHLFRERASPEVREFVPLPSLHKLAPESKERYPGLERIAEPISQILQIHREVIQDNGQLRKTVAELTDEVHDMSKEIAESRRSFLPDVNRFLMSLFNYESELVRRDTVVSRSGDATITVTLEGIRPKKGAKPLRSLVHSVFIPQSVDGSLSIAGQPTRFDLREKPEDLVVDCQFRREAAERGAFHVDFPGGFHWSPNSGKLSYEFTYRLERPFVMTLEEAQAIYGSRTVHDTTLEWTSCFINKPVKRLEISISFPEGYAPRYVDKWVWWTETSFLESDYNLADQLLFDEDDGIEIEQGERTVVRLRARNPLLGFSYGVVWQPLSKRQFLKLIRR